jgi:hypothetical protein
MGCLVNAMPPVRPGTHCTGGWVGPRAGVDGWGKYRPHWDSIPGPSSPKLVAITQRYDEPPLIFCMYGFFFFISFPISVCLCFNFFMSNYPPFFIPFLFLIFISLHVSVFFVVKKLKWIWAPLNNLSSFGPHISAPYKYHYDLRLRSSQMWHHAVW